MSDEVNGGIGKIYRNTCLCLMSCQTTQKYLVFSKEPLAIS